MTILNFSQFPPVRITEQELANLIAKALRCEHQNDSAVIKRIDQKIDVSPHIIYRWYRADKPPKSTHLLRLASVYPEVLRTILEVIGRSDVWELCLAENIPQKMYARTEFNHAERPIYTIKYDTINTTINSEISVKLNQRQLWFVSELQKGKKLKAEDIIKKWDVSIATSRRDISELLKHEVIIFIGANKNGFYKINTKI